MAIVDRTKAIGDGTKVRVAKFTSLNDDLDTIGFLPLGALTDKSYDMSPNTVTSSADDQKGFSEQYVTGAELTISVSGEARVKDNETEFGFDTLSEVFTTKVNSQEQPVVWVEYQRGKSGFRALMVISSLSESSPSKEIVTYDVEFAVANSDTVTFFTETV